MIGAHDQPPPRDRPAGARADIDVLADLVPLAGREVVDVGCGDGSLMRAMAARGASVAGVEVSEAAVARAGERCVLGRADALPFVDASVDACVLMRSLHHVPAEAMPRAFEEAARVLRPGGAMYVAEPVAAGAYFELVALVDDEREVRALAQAAIAETRALRRVRTVDYAVPLRLGDFDAFRERVIGADPSRADRFAALEDELRVRFAALKEDTAPMRADLLRR